MKKIYNIFTQKGEIYDTVRITGKDDDDCQEQIDQYLTTKGDCYSEEVEQPRRSSKPTPKVSRKFQGMLDRLLPEE
jgi:hypothetical protein